MRKFNIIGFTLIALTIAGSAMAATSTGTLTVTGTLASSLMVTVESAGGTTGGLGTEAATSALGTISKFSAPPTDFTKATGASDFTLSSNIGVAVQKGNVSGTTCTLTALLQSAPASGLTWKVNGSTLSNVTPVTLSSTAAYGTTGTYSWDLVTAEAAVAGSIGNAIIFTATSN